MILRFHEIDNVKKVYEPPVMLSRIIFDQILFAGISIGIVISIGIGIEKILFLSSEFFFFFEN